MLLKARVHITFRIHNPFIEKGYVIIDQVVKSCLLVSSRMYHVDMIAVTDGDMLPVTKLHNLKKS